MAEVRPFGAIELAGIHIDLAQRVVTLQATDGRLAKLTFGVPTTLYEAPPPTPDSFDGEELQEESANRGAAELEPTIVVTGRLQTSPRAGRPDGRGRRTTWARIAVHEAGIGEAHLYGASFHRHTAALALGLEKGSQITVEGYPHVTADSGSKRLDTFSVINLVDFPGKPPRANRTAREPD